MQSTKDRGKETESARLYLKAEDGDWLMVTGVKLDREQGYGNWGAVC